MKFKTYAISFAFGLGLIGCATTNLRYENIELVERLNANHVILVGTPTVDEVLDSTQPNEVLDTVQLPRHYALVEYDTYQRIGSSAIFNSRESCDVSEGLAACRDLFERRAEELDRLEQQRQMRAAAGDDGY